MKHTANFPFFLAFIVSSALLMEEAVGLKAPAVWAQTTELTTPLDELRFSSPQGSQGPGIPLLVGPESLENPLIGPALPVSPTSEPAVNFQATQAPPSEKKSPAEKDSFPKKLTNPSGAEPIGQQQAAMDKYNHGVQLFKTAQAQAEKGNELGQQRLLKQAQEEFNTALKLNPALVEAQGNLGLILLTQKDFKKAVKAFERALEIKPNHLNSLNNLAITYNTLNRVEEAYKTLDRLTLLDPGNPQYWFNKGSVLQKLGKLELAEKAYLEAVRLYPQEQRSLFNLAVLYQNQGTLEKARDFYTKAKRADASTAIGLEAARQLQRLETPEKPSAFDALNP